MGLRNQMPEALNPKGYQDGYEARRRSESMWRFGWLEASWRLGWQDAGKDLLAGIVNPLPKKRRKKGNK